MQSTAQRLSMKVSAAQLPYPNDLLVQIEAMVSRAYQGLLGVAVEVEVEARGR
jgi:hypothetical protein